MIFAYLDKNNMEQFSPKYGGDADSDNNAKTNRIIILEWEKIAGISGTVGPYGGFIVITSLFIIVGTNVYPHGTPRGTPFSLPLTLGEVSGFFGTYGACLYSLGVKLSPNY
nr:hypothetical protein [Tanacetum cinerariifolium]